MPLRIRYPVRKERGPNGRGLCRYCGKEVPKGRRTWCSEKCLKIALSECDWQVMRDRVFREQAGVCEGCGMDTSGPQRSIDDMRWHSGRRKRAWRWLTDRGFNHERSLWEIDHIVPRVEGGGDDRENLRLLCVPCHKKDTKELAARIALQRRRSKNRDVK